MSDIFHLVGYVSGKPNHAVIYIPPNMDVYWAIYVLNHAMKSDPSNNFSKVSKTSRKKKQIANKVKVEEEEEESEEDSTE